ncbi:hypothetical protein L2737_18980, partial [Shewanella electrodiphila]
DNDEIVAVDSNGRIVIKPIADLPMFDNGWGNGDTPEADMPTQGGHQIIRNGDTVYVQDTNGDNVLTITKNDNDEIVAVDSNGRIVIKPIADLPMFDNGWGNGDTPEADMPTQGEHQIIRNGDTVYIIDENGERVVTASKNDNGEIVFVNAAGEVTIKKIADMPIFDHGFGNVPGRDDGIDGTAPCTSNCGGGINPGGDDGDMAPGFGPDAPEVELPPIDGNPGRPEILPPVDGPIIDKDESIDNTIPGFVPEEGQAIAKMAEGMTAEQKSNLRRKVSQIRDAVKARLNR